MQELINSLKGQVNSLNLIILLAVIGTILLRLKKKSAKPFLIVTGILFYLLSTDYLPHALATWLERKYPPILNCSAVRFRDRNPVIIHVLGGGSSEDPEMNALAQLSLESNGRLTEGLRLFHCFKNATLVFSGYTPEGSSGMGRLYQSAAISMGVDSLKIKVLEAPATTREEALYLKRIYSTSTNLIVVTSAIHLPRAMHIFTRTGFHPIAAPANFLVKEDNTSYHFGFWPSSNNFRIMDAVMREILGLIKYEFQSDSE